MNKWCCAGKRGTKTANLILVRAHYVHVLIGSWEVAVPRLTIPGRRGSADFSLSIFAFSAGVRSSSKTWSEQGTGHGGIEREGLMLPWGQAHISFPNFSPTLSWNSQTWCTENMKITGRLWVEWGQSTINYWRTPYGFLKGTELLAPFPT